MFQKKFLFGLEIEPNKYMIKYSSYLIIHTLCFLRLWTWLNYLPFGQESHLRQSLRAWQWWQCLFKISGIVKKIIDRVLANKKD